MRKGEREMQQSENEDEWEGDWRLYEVGAAERVKGV